jgi:hypothetical protein
VLNRLVPIGYEDETGFHYGVCSDRGEDGWWSMEQAPAWWPDCPCGTRHGLPVRGMTWPAGAGMGGAGFLHFKRVSRLPGSRSDICRGGRGGCRA